MFIDGEGINGCCYFEELDFGGEYEYSHSRYKKDSLYYHKKLFSQKETPELRRETEKAYMFKVEKGLFWVPKSLVRKKLQSYKIWIVHKKFTRKYI